MGNNYVHGQGLKGRWRTTTVDEFGKVGLTVITRCVYCDDFHEGHRDKGRKWHEKHMKKAHLETYKVLKATPTKRNKRFQRSKGK